MSDFNNECIKILDNKYLIQFSDEETEEIKTKKSNKIIEFFEKTFDGGMKTYTKEYGFLLITIIRSNKSVMRYNYFKEYHTGSYGQGTKVTIKELKLKEGDYLEKVAIERGAVGKQKKVIDHLNVDIPDMLKPSAYKNTFEIYKDYIQPDSIEYLFYTEDKKALIPLTDNGDNIDPDLHNDYVFKRTFYYSDGTINQINYYRFIKVTYEDIVNFYYYLLDV